MYKKITKFLTAVFICCMGSAYASSNLEVCAVPQAYSALETIKELSLFPFESFYGTMQDVETRALYTRNSCNIIITNEERIASNLIKEGKIRKTDNAKLLKARLILWSANRFLFRDNIKPIINKKLKNLSVPKASLTTVGFAASQVLKTKNFPSDYLKKKNSIYYSDHEYQTYAMVRGGNIQCGFLTMPLIIRDGNREGSYWNIPQEYYSPVYYYLINTQHSDLETNKLADYLRNDVVVKSIFTRHGFDPL